jgi:hypothetical protein
MKATYGEVKMSAVPVAGYLGMMLELSEVDDAKITNDTVCGEEIRCDFHRDVASTELN